LYSTEKKLRSQKNKHIFPLKAHCGVKGIVKDRITDQVIRNAEVRVEDTKPVSVSTLGEFWKLVLPGTYTMVSDEL